MSHNKVLLDLLKDKYLTTFKSNPAYYKAPGRINLIGEHTDYNNGFVLPAAIDKAIYFAAGRNSVNKLRLFSTDYDEYFESDLSELKKSNTHWANYLIGVTAQFQKKELFPGGIDCVFGGDIPLGAGLSSSAALECGIAICINDQYNYGIPKSELILMAQKAEHDFAGVMCGIMDQFASTFGKENHVMKLDCRSLNYEYFPFANNEIEIILCDTKVKHSLASSEYNIRRKECEKGVEIIRQKYSRVQSLRDVKPEWLEELRHLMDAKVYQRCHFVTGEILRVENACHALLKNDFITFGKLMYETHRGLSKDYEVSCKELDILVDIALNDSKVLGSRMMGGGFGGCTINLVMKEDAEKFISGVKEAYKKHTGIETEIYRVQIAEGAGIINTN